MVRWRVPVEGILKEHCLGWHSDILNGPFSANEICPFWVLPSFCSRRFSILNCSLFRKRPSFCVHLSLFWKLLRQHCLWLSLRPWPTCWCWKRKCRSSRSRKRSLPWHRFWMLALLSSFQLLLIPSLPPVFSSCWMSFFFSFMIHCLLCALLPLSLFYSHSFFLSFVAFLVFLSFFVFY